MIGELLQDRRRSATACAATWRCWCCPTSSSGPGARRAAAVLARGDRGACASSVARLHASWPRSTGTWNGRCSSRASTTPTTSGSTTACATGTPRPVREHLHAGLDYQDKLARFLENHDEPRAAATFPPGMHEAAAVITFLSPGLRFFHQGQFEGARSASRRTSFAPRTSPSNAELERFYERLLAVLRQPVRPRRDLASPVRRAGLGWQPDRRQIVRRVRLVGAGPPLAGRRELRTGARTGPGRAGLRRAARAVGRAARPGDGDDR